MRYQDELLRLYSLVEEGLARRYLLRELARLPRGYDFFRVVDCVQGASLGTPAPVALHARVLLDDFQEDLLDARFLPSYQEGGIFTALALGAEAAPAERPVTAPALRDSALARLRPLARSLLDLLGREERPPLLFDALARFPSFEVLDALGAHVARGLDLFHAARAAALSGVPGALEVVCRALRSNVESEDYPALLLLLGRLPSPQSLEVLTEAVECSPAPHVCASVATALAAFEAGAGRPLARKLLDSARAPQLVAHLLATLSAWRSNEDSPAIVRLFETNPNPFVRLMALRALGHTGGPVAVKLCLRTLRLGPDALRVEALRGLARQGFDPAQTPKLFVSLTESGAPRVVSLALLSLAVRSPEAVLRGPLCRLLQSGDESSLLMAAHCLGYIQSSAARGLLCKLARSGSPAVRREAVHALGKYPANEASNQALMQLLGQRDSGVREEAARLLVNPFNVVRVEMGRMEVVEALTAFFEEDPASRAWVLCDLAKLGQGKAHDLLGRMVTHESRAVAAAALEALGVLPSLPDAGPFSKARGSVETWRRARGCLGLWISGHLEAVPELVALLGSEAAADRLEGLAVARDFALLVPRLAAYPSLEPLRRKLEGTPERPAPPADSSAQPAASGKVEVPGAFLAAPLARPTTPQQGDPFGQANVKVNLDGVELEPEASPRKRRHQKPLMRAVTDLPAYEAAGQGWLSTFRVPLAIGLVLLLQTGFLVHLRAGSGEPGGPPVVLTARLAASGAPEVVSGGGAWLAEGSGRPRPVLAGEPLVPPGSLKVSGSRLVRVTAGPVAGNLLTLTGDSSVTLVSLEKPGPTPYHYRLALAEPLGVLEYRAGWGRPSVEFAFDGSRLEAERACLELRRGQAGCSLALLWGRARFTAQGAAQIELSAGYRYDLTGGRLAGEPLPLPVGGGR